MKKRVEALCLTVCLMFSSNVVGAANIEEIDQGITEETRSRVYEEVLNEDISSDEDVIRVALEQYEEKKATLAKTNRVVEDDYLSITQVVGQNVKANGTIEDDLISTGLLIVDKEGQRVPIDEMAQNSENLSKYNITASMNVSMTVDRQEYKVRLNWFNTTLQYNTSMKASSLKQDSKYVPEPFFEYDDIQKVTNNPVGNRAYHYIPEYKSMVTFSTLACGRSGRSVINAGSSSLIMAYGITDSHPEGIWQSK